MKVHDYSSMNDNIVISSLFFSAAEEGGGKLRCWIILECVLNTLMLQLSSRVFGVFFNHQPSWIIRVENCLPCLDSREIRWENSESTIDKMHKAFFFF